MLMMMMMMKKDSRKIIYIYFTYSTAAFEKYKKPIREANQTDPLETPERNEL